MFMPGRWFPKTYIISFSAIGSGSLWSFSADSFERLSCVATSVAYVEAQVTKESLRETYSVVLRSRDLLACLFSCNCVEAVFILLLKLFLATVRLYKLRERSFNKNFICLCSFSF